MSDQDVKKQIIEAANRVYIKWGYHKSTMEDIAREAGKGKATLYYYFKSKEDVFRSVFDEQIDSINSEVKRKLSKLSKASDKLKKLFILMYREGIDRATVFNLLVHDVREDSRLFQRLRELFDSTQIALVERIITEGIESKEFRSLSDEELYDLAYTVTSMLRSITINNLIENRVPDEFQRIETISDFIVRGLIK